MAGTVVADFLQPQSAYGLTIQTPTGNTIATINSAGIFSNTGQQLLSYTGNVTGNIVSTGTITGNLVANSVSIGTTSTSYPLYIQQNPSSNNQPMVALNPTNSTNASYIYFNNAGSGGLNIGRSDSNGNGSGLTLTAYDSFVATTGTTGLSFHTNNTKAAYITSGQVFQFNSGYGSVATAYGCRAWGKFDGNAVSIISQGNFSSITQNSTGNYTANFTTNMPDANYSCVGNAENLNDAVGCLFVPYNYYTTGINFLIVQEQTGSYVRARTISIAVFR
jgi:hypothetical protein